MLFIATTTLSFAVQANQTVFERLDSSVSLNGGVGVSGNYYNAIGGLEANILAHNIWGSITVNGLSNLQTNGLPVAQPERMSSGLALTGKIGYSIVVADVLNIIPYVGLGYNASTSTYHVNSQPILNSNENNIEFAVGVKPELAHGSWIKLSIDSNVTQEYQELAVHLIR